MHSPRPSDEESTEPLHNGNEPLAEAPANRHARRAAKRAARLEERREARRAATAEENEARGIRTMRAAAAVSRAALGR